LGARRRRVGGGGLNKPKKENASQKEIYLKGTVLREKKPD